MKKRITLCLKGILPLLFIFMSCNNGISEKTVYLDASIEKTEPIHTLSGEDITVIKQDKHRNVWYGTRFNGIFRQTGSKIEQFNRMNGLIGNHITTIVEDNIGTIWIGTESGISQYDGVNIINHTVPNGLSHKLVYSIFEDSKGTIWAGTYKGLSRFNGKNFEQVKIPLLSNNGIYDIAEEHSGRLWFATDQVGLLSYDGIVFSKLKNDSLASNSGITSITKGENDQLYFGSLYSGLLRLNNQKLEVVYQTGDSTQINAVFKDFDGNIWFGVNNNGVVRYDGKRFIEYNSEHILPLKSIETIFKERINNFWLGGNNDFYKDERGSFKNMRKVEVTDRC